MVEQSRFPRNFFRPSARPEGEPKDEGNGYISLFYHALPAQCTMLNGAT